jgi:excinuclease ABC subunit C
MVSKISDIEVIITDSEVEALILEATLIKKLRPHYNIDLKDDKSYPYIVITNEPYPRIFVTRRIIRDGSRYFGPFTDVKNMRSSLKMVREIFRVRSCNYFIDEEVIRKNKIKVCLDYHIKKCDGPCEGIISRQNYASMIEEVALVLKGKTSKLILGLQTEMQKASDDLRYEDARGIRDKINRLSVYGERQKVVDADLTDRDLFALASEANDSCCVVFNVREGKIINRKHFYISGVESQTDEETLEQFVERYYLDEEDYPAEIFLTLEIADKSALQKWLTQKKGQKVEIVTPKIGDKAKLMNMCKNNAQLLLDELKLQKLKWRDFTPNSVLALQRDLKLPNAPRRIECFDISNLQGTDTVASMVVFTDGKPNKSEYRKYKLETQKGQDDFASMREIISRRYRRLLDEQGSFPDLIVVDGGKGQLTSALAALQQIGILRTDENMQSPTSLESNDISYITKSLWNLHIIALAKRLEEIYIPGSNEPQSLPKTSSGLKLLRRIRDEAHRTAVTYHRILRTKRTLNSELDLIEGIGKKYTKELLETFGSVQAIKFATIEQLSEIVGLKVANKVQEYFNMSE